MFIIGEGGRSGREEGGLGVWWLCLIVGRLRRLIARNLKMSMKQREGRKQEQAEAGMKKMPDEP